MTFAERLPINITETMMRVRENLGRLRGAADRGESLTEDKALLVDFAAELADVFGYLAYGVAMIAQDMRERQKQTPGGEPLQ